MARLPRTEDPEEETSIQDLADSARLLRLGITAATDRFDDDADGAEPSATMLMSTVTPTSASELENWAPSNPATTDERRAATVLTPAVEDAEITDDPVRMYLREIGRVSLLTARDERVLARAIELYRRQEAIQNELAERE